LEIEGVNILNKMKKNTIRKRRSVRKKKSILENNIFSGFLFLIILISLSAYFFIFFPFFQIESITIEETEGLNRDSLEEYIKKNITQNISLFTTKSIFLISPEKIEEGILKETLTVEDIKIRRSFPATLVVETSEREPIMYWCKDKSKESCFYVGKVGFVFKRAEVLEKDFLIFTTYYTLPKDKKITNAKMIENFFLIKKELNGAGLKIDYIKISSPTKIKVSLLNGFELYLLREDIDGNLSKLKAFLKKEEVKLDEKLEYIDLRFEDRIFYK